MRCIDATSRWRMLTVRRQVVKGDEKPYSATPHTHLGQVDGVDEPDQQREVVVAQVAALRLGGAFGVGRSAGSVRPRG